MDFKGLKGSKGSEFCRLISCRCLPGLLSTLHDGERLEVVRVGLEECNQHFQHADFSEYILEDVVEAKDALERGHG